jgi:hypothetical protein
MSEPLTDEELAEMQHDLAAEVRSGPGRPYIRAETALRLVAEVRRLRSDVALKDGAIERLKAGWSAANEQVEKFGRENERLRSDEWLRAFALELAPDRAEGWSGFTTEDYVAEMLALLRKHRDGKP